MSRANVSVLPSCPTQEMLLRFLEGELEAGDDLAAHLEVCVSCQESLDQLSRESTLSLRGRSSPPWTPSPEWLQRLQASGATDNSQATPASAESEYFPAMAGYRVVGVLGQGGMGVVYEGVQKDLDRPVALKTLRADKVSDELRARLRREAEAIARLNHPNIVQIYEVGDWQPTTGAPALPYLAMERVFGAPLGEWLAGRPQSPQLAAEFTEVMARAMHAAHETGIVHRDLKPSNVLVQTGDDVASAVGQSTHDGHAGATATAGPKASGSIPPVVLKITDFGLAKDMDAGTSLTETGQVVGTPNYMAPEQVRAQAKEIGPAADIYALGAMLFEMLTSRPPFIGKTPMEILWQVISVEPLPPRQFLPAIPRDLDTICVKCLEKDPRKRYATALELAEDLQRFRRGDPIVARPLGPIARALRWCRRKPAVAALWAVVALLLLGSVAAGFWYQHDRSVHASDELSRQAETRRKRELAEQRVADAMRQAQEIRDQLETNLRRPGKLALLINDPGRWSAPIEAARALLDRAAAHRDGADGPLSEDLQQDFQRLAEQLGRDEADRQLALRLERIRLDRSTWIDGSFDFALAMREYPAAFGQAGLCTQVDTNNLRRSLKLNTSLIRKSVIKEQLLAALDDWAFVAAYVGQNEEAAQLLSVARDVDPDPARDRMRNLGLRRKRAAFEEIADQTLASEAAFNKLSPAFLHVVGEVLNATGGANNRKAIQWLQRAQMWHAGDFWLNFQLANALKPSQPVDAAGYYRTALAVRPQSGAAWTNLGSALRLQKNFPAARHALLKAIEAEPRNARAWSVFGLNLLDQDDVPAAITACKKSVEFDPQSAKAWNNLGAALLRNEDRPGAIKAYRTAIDLDARYAKAWNNLGIALRGEPDLAGAIKSFEKAIAIEPNYVIAWTNLGQALRANKDSVAAIEAYKKAAAFDAQSLAAWMGLGNIHYEQRDWPAARNAFRHAVDAEPKNASAWYSLGNTQRELKNRSGAADAFKKAVDCNPKHAGAWNNLGSIYLDRDDMPAAIAAFKEAVAVAPNHGNAWTNLGRIYIYQKDYPNAIHAYRKALAVNSKNAASWNNLGVALQELNELAPAAEAFQKAIGQSPKMSTAHIGLGMVYRDQGRFVDALASIQKGIALTPILDRLAHLPKQYECERLLALEKRLPLVLKGQKTNPAEQAAVAELCWRYKDRPADAVLLYTAAFAADKRLAENSGKNHRTSAARAAVRAAGATTNAAAQADLRRQALEWLHAELARGTFLLKAEPPPDLTALLDKLTGWRKHADLASVRDSKSLDMLGEGAKQAWLAFWSDVDRLERDVRRQITSNKSR